MRKLVLLLLGAAAGCAGDSALPTPPPTFSATEVTHTNLFEPINTATFNIDNPCGGEDIINAVGTGHLSRTEIVKDGATRVIGSLNFEKVVGFGSISGQEYRLMSNTHFSQEFDVVEGGSFQLRQSFRAITQGPADNMFMHTLLEITFLAGGGAIVTVNEVTIECKG